MVPDCCEVRVFLAPAETGRPAGSSVIGRSGGRDYAAHQDSLPIYSDDETFEQVAARKVQGHHNRRSLTSFSLSSCSDSSALNRRHRGVNCEICGAALPLPSVTANEVVLA